MVTLIEGVASILGVLSIFFLGSKSRRGWLLAAMSSIGFFILFVQTHLPGQALLQVFYFLMSLYGYFTWENEETTLPIYTLPLIAHPLIVGSVIGGTFLSTKVLPGTLPTPISILDLSIMLGSLLANVLQVQRYRENWIYWMVLDTMATILFWYQKLFFTSMLFFLLLLLCFRGYSRWRSEPL